MAKVGQVSTFTEKWEVLHGDSLKSKGSSDTLKLKGVVPDRAKCFFNPLFTEEDDVIEIEIDHHPIVTEKIKKPIPKSTSIKPENKSINIKTVSTNNISSTKDIKSIKNNDNVNIKKKDITSSMNMVKPIKEDKDGKAVVTFDNNQNNNKSISINYLRQHSKITNNNTSNNHNTFKNTSSTANNSNISNQHINKALSNNKTASSADKHHSGAGGVPKKHGKRSESEIRAIIEKETGYKFVGKGRHEISAADASLNIPKKYQSYNPSINSTSNSHNHSSRQQQTTTSRATSSINTNMNMQQQQQQHKVPKAPSSLTTERIRRTVSKYVRDSTTNSTSDHSRERRVVQPGTASAAATRSSSNGGSRGHYYASSKQQNSSSRPATNGQHR